MKASVISNKIKTAAPVKAGGYTSEDYKQLTLADFEEILSDNDLPF